MKDYKEVNRHSWNTKTVYHLNSDFYDVNGFLNGKTSLNSIELKLLGNIEGKSILHLQCHFGQDSISLARMGAHVTGVDLSDVAIGQAIELADKAGEKVSFICCDIYDLPSHLDQQFDIVFTSYGVVGWLPDLSKWANVVDRFLKPAGEFIMVEFHPVVWMFNNNFDKIEYSYFIGDAIIETEAGTYADKDAPIELQSITWNHSLSEVLNSLLSKNLQITSFDEYDYSPYNCFNKTIESEAGRFKIEHLTSKLPMVYSITAVKQS